MYISHVARCLMAIPFLKKKSPRDPRPPQPAAPEDGTRGKDDFGLSVWHSDQHVYY
jgi:hypothetical protein